MLASEANALFVKSREQDPIRYFDACLEAIRQNASVGFCYGYASVEAESEVLSKLKALGYSCSASTSVGRRRIFIDWRRA